MRILIGYDGSSVSDAALEDLQWAGLPAQAEAMVLTVADVWVPPPPPPSPGQVDRAFAERVAAARERARRKAEDAVAAARAIATRGSERLRALFPQWTLHAEACADSPAWGIIRKADEWRPDLLVVGAHRRSALERWFVGSVSYKVLTEARCTVRIARGRARAAGTPIRLVVGSDGSPDADAAVQTIAVRSWPAGTEVRFVVVVDEALATMLGWSSFDEPAAQATLAKLLEPALQRLRAAPLAVSLVVKSGDPKRILVDEAERWDADCIFLGARGLRRLERFFIGSVSAAVAARAPCSVEVVHPA